MISAIIVSGGKSTRIGRDKKFLEINGKSFIEIAAGVAGEIADEVIIVVGSEEQMEETKSLKLKDVSIIVDIKENQGPVMGVLTGLHAARGEWAVIMPVDAPMMKAGVFKHMLGMKKGYDAVVPLSGFFLEPMYAVYKRDVMIDACTSALEVGGGKKASLHNIVRGLEKVNYILVEEFKKFDKELLTFFNVNTESDLEGVLEMTKKKKK
jgi:molybdopterin-guanine dinucleotide biosynthesis protein A